MAGRKVVLYEIIWDSEIQTYYVLLKASGCRVCNGLGWLNPYISSTTNDKDDIREDDDDDAVATNHGDQEDTARCPTQPIRTRVS